MSASSFELVTGQMVGEYRIERKIGEGGFGTVYAAVHPVIGKPAAIKVLNPMLSGNKEMVDRFVDEARAVNQIRHRHIIDIFAFGTLPNGASYFVMELLEGMTFQKYLRDNGPLDPGTAFSLLWPVGRALAAAHKAGIAHRDLKPDNIFLVSDQDGGVFPVLLDFGIAKLIGESDMAHRTRTGMLLGTPVYMSPEQCRATKVDHRSDIYAFGIIVHEALSGKRPFDAENVMDVIMKQISEPPPKLSACRPGVPLAFDAPILRMLEKSPAKRPQTILEALDELAEAARSVGIAAPASSGQPAGPVSSGAVQLRPSNPGTARASAPVITPAASAPAASGVVPATGEWLAANSSVAAASAPVPSAASMAVPSGAASGPIPSLVMEGPRSGAAGGPSLAMSQAAPGSMGVPGGPSLAMSQAAPGPMGAGGPSLAMSQAAPGSMGVPGGPSHAMSQGAPGPMSMGAAPGPVSQGGYMPVQAPATMVSAGMESRASSPSFPGGPVSSGPVSGPYSGGPMMGNPAMGNPMMGGPAMAGPPSMSGPIPYGAPQAAGAPAKSKLPLILGAGGGFVLLLLLLAGLAIGRGGDGGSGQGSGASATAAAEGGTVKLGAAPPRVGRVFNQETDTIMDMSLTLAGANKPLTTIGSTTHRKYKATVLAINEWQATRLEVQFAESYDLEQKDKLPEKKTVSPTDHRGFFVAAQDSGSSVSAMDGKQIDEDTKSEVLSTVSDLLEPRQDMFRRPLAIGDSISPPPDIAARMLGLTNDDPDTTQRAENTVLRLTAIGPKGHSATFDVQLSLVIEVKKEKSTVTADLKGTMTYDVATGIPTSGKLSGPLEGSATEQGIKITIAGSASVQMKNDVQL